MSTSSLIDLESALAGIAKRHRTRVLKRYYELKRRGRRSVHAGEHDSAGISAGKFCEEILRWLQQDLTGTHIPFGQSIGNFGDECRKLVKLPKAAGPESLRTIVPRALVFLYTIRGKRDIGHTGGDVEANKVDLAVVTNVTDWVMCELVRVYHDVSLEEAQTLVDMIATRDIPDVWEVRGKKRVLLDGLTYPEKTLLLLYSEPEAGVLAEDLFEWANYSNFGMYKSNVLSNLDKQNLIYFDRDEDIVVLSPLGARDVEDRILAKAWMEA